MARKRQHATIGLLLALLCLSFPAQAKDRTQQHTLRWIEKLIENAGKLPRRGAGTSFKNTGVAGYAFAQDALGNYIRQYGESPRALKNLALCHVGEGHFSAAVSLYQNALHLNPNSKDTKQKLAAAQRTQQLAGAMALQFTEHRPVIQIRTLQESGKKYYLALRLKEFEFDLVLFSASPLKKLYALNTGSTGYPAQLFIANILGGTAPEIIFWEPQPDSGGSRSQIYIYHLHDGRLVSIAKTKPLLNTWLEDLDGDGNYEVGGKREVGGVMCHAGMPRMNEVFSWRKGSYRVADLRFPKEFRGQLNILRKTLTRWPGDCDLLMQEGWLYEINKRPRQALAAYRRAWKNRDVYHYNHTDRWIKSRIEYIHNQS